MGCLPSKDKANAKKSPEAGYFAVSYTFKGNIPAEETPEPEPKQIEETKTESEPKSKRLGRPLFGGGMSSGFGQFQTMFSQKVEEEKKEKVKEKPKPASKVVDMAFVYQVPKSKLNIIPYADNKGYIVRDGRVKGLLDTDDNTRQLLDHFRISLP